MGYKIQSVIVSATLSSHNDDRDKRDREAWESFLKDLNTLVNQPRYAHICLDVD